MDEQKKKLLTDTQLLYVRCMSIVKTVARSYRGEEVTSTEGDALQHKLNLYSVDCGVAYVNRNLDKMSKLYYELSNWYAQRLIVAVSHRNKLPYVEYRMGEIITLDFNLSTEK